MFNQSRRKLLKTLAYGSALATGGLSSAVLANNVASKMASANKKSVTLFNQSDKTVTLDANQPVTLQNVNGWAVVNINKQNENKAMAAVKLAPGEKAAFRIDAQASLLDATGDYIVITNEFSSLNNMIPVSTLDAAVA